MPFRTAYRSNSGFSLVELSIVLVILGLLTGGILGGRALIHSAELNSVVSDISEYQTAFHTFQAQYACLPGDCEKISQYYADIENGNGDGYVDCKYSASTTFCTGSTDEHVMAIKSLQAAGLLKRDSSAVDGMPKTGLRECRINIYNENASMLYGHARANYLRIYQPLTASPWNADCMTPQEAYTLDMKLDEGVPSKGNVLGKHFSSVGTYDECVDKPFDSAQPDAVYQLQSEEVACSLFVRL